TSIRARGSSTIRGRPRARAVRRRRRYDDRQDGRSDPGCGVGDHHSLLRGAVPRIPARVRLAAGRVRRELVRQQSARHGGLAVPGALQVLRKSSAADLRAGEVAPAGPGCHAGVIQEKTIEWGNGMNSKVALTASAVAFGIFGAGWLIVPGMFYKYWAIVP